MGTGNLTARSNSQTIDQTWWNTIHDALEVDFLPRNSSGVPTDIAGSLGSSSLQFLKLFIRSGGWIVGDIKLHHSYNTTAPIGQGWMLCDGRTISSTTYEAEHAIGDWNTYIGSSPLDGLKLPNFTGRYPIGVATTPLDGTGTITPTGNASSQVNLQHAHTLTAHSHTVNAHTHTVSSTSQAASGVDVTPGVSGPTASATPGTDSQTPTMNNQLSATQSIKPDSIEVQYYMRII